MVFAYERYINLKLLLFYCYKLSTIFCHVNKANSPHIITSKWHKMGSCHAKLILQQVILFPLLQFAEGGS